MRKEPWGGVLVQSVCPGAEKGLPGEAWWGVMSKHCPVAASTVENQAHCDFVKLRNMLIRTHMHDLKDVTCDVHYENYRAQCIQQMTRWVPTSGGRGSVTLCAVGVALTKLIGQEAVDLLGTCWAAASRNGTGN